ncbi:inactive dipeptidyl peptidase 10 [Platysternon megacephalum]|uniref:Inactive dipeptidyl peptidase 10 n=1 Tax=Platysternon megacephalum TaxID=55544 RepID=A0A4D9EUB4_9SAUR|nr:inactive dipeptidyl peptidase 10 [Platysternon megacephalum]
MHKAWVYPCNNVLRCGGWGRKKKSGPQGQDQILNLDLSIAALWLRRFCKNVALKYCFDKNASPCGIQISNCSTGTNISAVTTHATDCELTQITFQIWGGEDVSGRFMNSMLQL